MPPKVEKTEAQKAVVAEPSKVMAAREAPTIVPLGKEHEWSLEEDELDQILALLWNVSGFAKDIKYGFSKDSVLSCKQPNLDPAKGLLRQNPVVIMVYGQKYEVDLKNGFVYTDDPRFHPVKPVA